MPNSLAIIGAGRVGRALGRRLRELGWKIGAVVTRNEESARKAVRFIGAGRAHAAAVRGILASNVILVSVPDDAVQQVSHELTRIGAEELLGKIVLHTSGALDSSALSELKESGAAVGGMHPLQTFSGVGIPPLEGKIFAIEGDTKAVRVARQMARSLGGLPVRIAPGKKILYHTAAAFAAGHVLAIEEAANQLLIAVGMKRGEAVRALLPLTRQVLDNYERLGPRPAWTGPLARGDYKIIAAHLEALRHAPPEFAEALQSLNRLGARVLAQNPSAVLAELEEISVGKKANAKGGNA
jgi:predicted short-subunit dehydrogenase-like oxidoreductase (DUF2520 family)